MRLKAMAKSGPRHLGLMRQGLASAFAHGLRPGRASRAEPPGLASPLRVDGLDRVGPYPCRRSSEGRSAAFPCLASPSSNGSMALTTPASALDRVRAVSRSRVERRPVSGFPCPGKAASQPAPALASLEQAPQRLAPWVHGPQPRPSHWQSPSAPPIDPPPGLVLSPQSPHKSGATSHRKVFVTRHISIDDGPHSPPAYPAPHAFGTIARSDGSVQMSSSRDKCPCVRCGIGCVRCGRGSVYRKQAGFCVLECTLLYNID